MSREPAVPQAHQVFSIEVYHYGPEINVRSYRLGLSPTRSLSHSQAPVSLRL